MINQVHKASKLVLYDMPFYGGVLLSLQKEINNRKTKTACVGLNGIMYKMSFNSDFFDSLSLDHRRGLLLHELGHIIYFHLTDYTHLTDHKIANIAMDVYINQTIPDDLLPPKACVWNKYKNLKKGKSTNWYYEQLVENKKNGDDKALENMLSAMGDGDGDGNGDGNNQPDEADDGQGGTMLVPDHNWDEVQEASDATQKMLKKNTEVLMRDIVKTLKSQPGTIPGDIQDLLDRLEVIEPPKFNWRKFMRTFVGTSTKTWVTKTRRKKSKRFPDMQGSKEKYFSNILVAIDTSLSVDDEDVQEFRNELHHMHKTGHDIDIVLCDTHIRSQFRFNPRKPMKIEGRGGTEFQPVIDLYRNNLKKYSCLIYLTDGECGPPENARGNILWVHASKYEINERLPGRRIKLEL